MCWEADLGAVHRSEGPLPFAILVAHQESILQTAKELGLPQSLAFLLCSLLGASVGPIQGKNDLEPCISWGSEAGEESALWPDWHNQQEHIVQTIAVACSALFGPWPAQWLFVSL